MIFSYRTVKKIIYLLGAMGVIVTGIFLITYSPAPPSEEKPTPASTFKPIEVESVVVIPHLSPPGPKGRTVDIVARLRNANPRTGTHYYPLKFTLYNPRGDEIANIDQAAYLLPGALQYIVALDVPIPFETQLGRIEVTKPFPSDVIFISLPENINPPSFSTFLRDRTTYTTGDISIERQTGIVTNTGTLNWQKVEVTAVALDNADNVIAVGKTFVGRLLVGEQREFTLQWPKPPVETNRVITIPSTNIFREENFVEIVGDPNTIR